ncbi:MAG: hypothetical protein Q9182_007014 [Xanthomendoza sp. 2 TL-2023]
MSPSMISSGGPSPESTVAFAPIERTGMHHSVSPSHMDYQDIEEYPEQTFSRYTSGPSSLVPPNELSSANFGNPPAGRNEMIRQSNILKMNEPSYGSPYRYVGKSPNPRDQASARAPCPPVLDFGNIREIAPTEDSAVPKSAPAHIKSFQDRTMEKNSRPWDANHIDDCWQQGSNQMELLQAQFGNLGPPSDAPVQNHTNTAYSTGTDNGAVPSSFNGNSFADLDNYVVLSQTGRLQHPIPELERLMSTMLGLRDNNNVLLSIERSARDLLRQYMYEQIFGSGDGRSPLSREHPNEIIDVAGQGVTRMGLHHQIVDFLEDRLEWMTRSPDPQTGTHQANELNASEYHGNGISHHHSTSPPDNDHVKEAKTGVSDRERKTIGGSNVGTSSMLAAQNVIPEDQSSSQPHSFEGGYLAPTLGIGNNPTQAFHGHGLAVVPNLSSQSRTPGPWDMPSGSSYGPQEQHLYGQPPVGTVPQHGNNASFSHQVFGPQGILYAQYSPSQSSPWSSYAGGQAFSQAGPLIPYESQYGKVTEPGGNLISAPRLPMNAYQHWPAQSPYQHWPAQPPYQHWPAQPPYQHWPAQPPYQHWPAQQPYLQHSVGPRIPHYLGSVYGTMNRANSPSRNPDGSFRARTPRAVVSEVIPLPYRPGSDDMYPHGQHGGSVQYQELTRNGGPTYESATRAEVLPFAENARKWKPAEWGVLRIGNVSPKQ